MFIGNGFLDWMLVVFPCWMLLVSVYILIENLKQPLQPAAIHDR
jgi:hypothetical protein